MLSGRDQNDKTPLSKRIFDDMVRHIMTLARTIAPMPHLDSRVSRPRTLGDVLDFTINTTMHGKSDVQGYTKLVAGDGRGKTGTSQKLH